MQSPRHGPRLTSTRRATRIDLDEPRIPDSTFFGRPSTSEPFGALQHARSCPPCSGFRRASRAHGVADDLSTAAAGILSREDDRSSDPERDHDILTHQVQALRSCEEGVQDDGMGFQ